MCQNTNLNKVDKSSKILITGVNGLLGSYILRYLILQGYSNIHGLVREGGRIQLIPKEILGSVKIVIGDILDYALIDNLTKQMDYVIHAAAEVNFNSSRTKKLFKSNVDGTRNIANSCLVNGVKKLVYISSTAALGRLYDGQKIDENEMWEYSEMNTKYAISKHYGELEVWRAHEEGLGVGILNPSLIMSPGYFDRSSAGLFTRIYNKINYYPTGTNGVVDVRDAAQLAILLLEHKQKNLKVIACADNIKYKKLFTLIAQSFGKNIPSKPISSSLRFLLQSFFSIKSILGFNIDISKASLLNASMDFYYTNQLSKSLFSYTYIPVVKSISDSCKAFETAKTKGENYCLLEIE